MRYLSGSLSLCCFLCSSVFGQVNFTSSNLPIIVIDTHGVEISDEPKLMADMGIIDNGPGQRNNLTDAFNNYNGKIGIEYRGSTSQMFPKKPYGFELWDESGLGVSMPLLGMPPEEDWCLIATYNDKSLMRDALAYKLGRDLGWYAPRTRFCELVLKKYVTIGGVTTVENDYRGIYMLTEKIKRDKNRVDISKLEPHEITGDDLTGGYILKIDKFEGNSGAGFNSQFSPLNRSGNQQITFQYEYPEYDEIVPEQKQYIQAYINKFESVLYSSTYADKVNGYVKYIDVDSFVDYMILHEVSKNVDGYRLSTFIYKDKNSNDGKLTMGPIWDFNLAFGNADYCSGSPVDGWMYNFNNVCNNDFWLIPFWWQRLRTDHNFMQRLAARWADLRTNKLSDSAIEDYIDSVAQVLDAEAVDRNFSTWPVLGTYVWPNAYVGATYESEVIWLKFWVSQRLNWLDNNMPDVVTASEPDIENETFFVHAYPNPFHSSLQFQYAIPKPCKVTIEVFDLMGKRIAVKEQDHRSEGDYQITFEQLNAAEGIYFFKACTSLDKYTVTRRIVKHK